MQSENNQYHTLDFERAPAYAVLFHLGKKSMRPGGLALTQHMLNDLKIDSRDDVVEFAPGRGLTRKMVLKRDPRSYTAVERDAGSQQKIQEILNASGQGRCVVGKAEETGLPDECATVIFGEAMLTMQTQKTKLRIVQEAFRLLRPGGRYGIHETCLLDNAVSEEKKDEIEKALKKALRVGARPLLLTEWKDLLEKAGFSARQDFQAPMRLLSLKRLIQDEGLFGAMRFVSRVLRSPGAHQRIHKIQGHLANMAITLIRLSWLPKSQADQP